MLRLRAGFAHGDAKISLHAVAQGPLRW